MGSAVPPLPLGSDRRAALSSPRPLLEQVPPLSAKEMSGGWSQPCTLEQTMCTKKGAVKHLKINTLSRKPFDRFDRSPNPNRRSTHEAHKHQTFFGIRCNYLRESSPRFLIFADIYCISSFNHQYYNDFVSVFSVH